MTPADLIPLLPPRLSEKFTVDPDGCWRWTAAKQQGGYGMFKWQGIGQPAHRVVYRLIVGPIPAGMDVDHTCRVPECVSPDHLRLLPVSQNRADNGAATRRRRSA